MTQTSFSNFIYLQVPEALSGLIEMGEVTQESMEEAADAYAAFLSEIEASWPPDKLKTWLIQRQRDAYKFYRQRKAEIELENRDARTRGVSYKERQAYTKQLKALDTLMIETVTKGRALKKTTPSVKSFIRPIDAEFIHKHGLALHLKYATI